MTQFLVTLALLGSGLAAGGLMIAARGAPLLLRLPTEQYVPVHQFLVTRFDPIMPIAILVGLVSDLVLAFDAAPNRAAQTLYGAAALLLLCTISVSLTRNVPINRWVASLDPDALPENFDQLDRRTRWVSWNLVRTVLAISAFTANVAAVGALL
ncbi:DUF1772 domain-containing protein [Actinomycetes bacterium KLBMP 9797]